MQTRTQVVLRLGSAGSNRFTFEKLFFVYNFGTDNGAESEFGTDKELIIHNIFKYKINLALIDKINIIFDGLKKRN